MILKELTLRKFGGGSSRSALQLFGPGRLALAAMGACALIASALLPGLSALAETLIALGGLLAIFAVSLSIFRRAQRLLNEAIDRDEATASLALEDPLTRLPNRTAFNSYLEFHLGNMPRDSETQVAIIYADLDHFKEVNDSLGHSAGDELLEEVASRFRSAIRKDDLLARIGGDEFAFVLHGAQAQSRAANVAERLIESLRQPIMTKGNLISVGVSAGIAAAQWGELDAEELIRRADVALYRAKGEARMCFRTFDPLMDDSSTRKRAMKSDLERALAENEMHVAFQPIFDARSGRLASAEALLRWTHPDKGVVAPAQFIPIAEEAGLISEISAFVLRTTLAAVKELGTVPIAVNVSPLQFRSRSFAHLVADSLLEASVAPEMLKIEITEGVLIRHTDAASQTLRQLRELGVKVVLDDFGTGYSSLSYLQNFAFDEMKIDRSFLRHLGARSQSTQLMRAIIDLGHSLDMKVVAEGIENAWQTSALQLLGCDYLQGFYLAVPSDLTALRACTATVIQAAPAASLDQPEAQFDTLASAIRPR